MKDERGCCRDDIPGSHFQHNSLQLDLSRGRTYTGSSVKEQSGSGNSSSENPCSAPSPLFSALIINWLLERYFLWYSCQVVVVEPTVCCGGRPATCFQSLIWDRRHCLWKCMSATDTKAMVLTLWGNKQPGRSPSMCWDTGACSVIVVFTPACGCHSVSLY